LRAGTLAPGGVLRRLGSASGSDARPRAVLGALEARHPAQVFLRQARLPWKGKSRVQSDAPDMVE